MSASGSPTPLMTAVEAERPNSPTSSALAVLSVFRLDIVQLSTSKAAAQPFAESPIGVRLGYGSAELTSPSPSASKSRFAISSNPMRGPGSLSASAAVSGQPRLAIALGKASPCFFQSAAVVEILNGVSVQIPADGVQSV